MSKKKYTLTKYEGVFGYETAKGRRFARKVSGVRKPDGTKGDSWKGGVMTAGAAREDRNQTLDQIRRRTYVAPTKLTFGDYLSERWLPTVKGNLRTTAYSSYEMIVRGRIPAWLANTPVIDITGGDLNRLYGELLTSGRKDGKGLAKNSVKNTHIVIHKALEDARRWNLVSRNVADDCDPPKQASPGSVEMKTWSRAQLNEFLAHVRDDRFYAAYLLAARTGMRRGEVLGLRLQDFDPASGRIQIRQTLISTDYELSFGKPKTDRGKRSITLDRETVAALQAHIARQAEEAKADYYQDHGLVFANEDGSPKHPVLFSQDFERHVREAALPMIRLHDLRHYLCLTRLASRDQRQDGLGPAGALDRRLHPRCLLPRHP
jgi:integrase